MSPQIDGASGQVPLSTSSSSSRPEALSQAAALSGGIVCSNRVSEKIRQLVNTLKRPKRRPLPEYYLDEDDQVLVQPILDPTAPRPRGTVTEPLIGEELVVSPFKLAYFIVNLSR
ncbi:unnamed protein product [Protopolystoma xenopodis]|uniref:Uncharacterized protein n=1 Tax=Protopolystoma xenopodis TaxID=117903 RepID=A0A3S5CQ81_9PLAT|nr:unnamed protein product [Protopolystoma xenopodis]